MDGLLKEALASPEFPNGAFRAIAMDALAPKGESILPAIAKELAVVVKDVGSEDWDTSQKARAMKSALALVQARILADAKKPLTDQAMQLLSEELDTYYDKDAAVLEDVLGRFDEKTRDEIFAKVPAIRPKDYRNVMGLAYLAPSQLTASVQAAAAIECGKYEDRYITSHAMAVAAFGSRAVEPILAVIEDAKSDGATSLGRALEKIADASHASALVGLLGHGAKGVRLAAAAALQRIGAPAKSAVEKGAQSKKKAIREACAELLASLSAEKSRADELLAEAAALPDRAAIVAMFEDGKSKDYPQYGGVPDEIVKRGAIALACAHEWMKERAEDYKARGVYNRTIELFDRDPDAAWLFAKMFASLPKISPYSYREFTGRMKRFGTNMVKPLVSVLKGPAFPLRAPLFELLALLDRKADVDLFVDALADSSKEIRGYAIDCLSEMGPEIGPKLVPLLSAKSADARLATAQVIEKVKASGVSDALAAALEAEKKPDVAAALERAIAATGGASTAAVVDDSEDGVLAALAKERKAKLPKWLDLAKLPALVTKSGKKIAGDALHGFVTRLMNEGPDARDDVARRLRPYLDDASACAFSIAIKDVWASNKGDSKHKWAIYQQAILVDDARLDQIGPRLDEVTSGGQHHLASWYVDVLARHSDVSKSNRGLSWVAHWAKSADTRALREKSNEVLEEAAKARGKTPSTLEPDLDAFVADDVADANIPIVEGTTLDFGSRTFELSIGVDLEPHLVLDGEPIAKLPAPTKKDDADKAKEAKETYSRFKKTLSAIAREQTKRLETAMVSARPWTKKPFEKLFFEHPIMKILGSKLVFTDGKTLFRPVDGELLDVDQRTMKLANDALVRLAHRMEMTDEQATQWGAQLGDAEIIQPFEQIGRTIHEKKDELAPPDRKIPPATLSGRLRGNGWRHASVEDAGMCYEAYRPFPGRKVRAYVAHEGVHVSDPGWSSDAVGISNVWFTDLAGTKIETEEVDPIVFSEVVRDLERMVES